MPVDYSYPFIDDYAFRNQVPTVVHVHGAATTTVSDGQPMAYYTRSGIKGADYGTVAKCAKNEAVFMYPN